MERDLGKANHIIMPPIPLYVKMKDDELGVWYEPVIAIGVFDDDEIYYIVDMSTGIIEPVDILKEGFLGFSYSQE